MMIHVAENNLHATCGISVKLLFFRIRMMTESTKKPWFNIRWKDCRGMQWQYRQATSPS